MSNVVKYFLQNKSVSWLLMALIVFGGLMAYVKMGKLEDAPFTIKQALVTTAYPGASPEEVQIQVTDVLEEAIQSLGELYYLKTDNRAGLSKITVFVKKEIGPDEMQQLWDNLRRKVGDAQSKLPAGASTSVVNDDFGDVLGVLYGISSDTHSNRELEQQSKLLKNELLKVKDVAKVELYGIQTPTIEIKISPTIMTQSGITTKDIAAAFERQNKITDAGAIETTQNRLRIDALGSFTALEEIENMTITSPSGEHFRLREIAEISEGYAKPARNTMYINNTQSIGIAISTVAKGNVVDMALLVKECIANFQKNMPSGYSLTNIYDQGKESSVANDGFILNLILSVVTVVLILLFFIGLKNGLLVGSGLVFSIFATLIYMWSTGIALQRMSLAAIIIAMGMLVDNAIVVSDSVLMNMQRGMRKRVAIMRAVAGTATPLLAATSIAILTFMPIYLSPDISGELLYSLFIVIAVSLLFSWIFSVTQTPFFIQEFVRRPRRDEIPDELYQSKFFTMFRRSLRWVIGHRWIVVCSTIVLLTASVWGFQFIPKLFMPQLNKQYFTMDMWMPEGTRIEKMDEMTQDLSDFLLSFDQTVQVSSFVGQTPPRYYLANANFGPQPNYSQCLIEASSPEAARELQNIIRDTIHKSFPDLFIRVNRFELSSVPQALIEARFCGSDAHILDSLTSVALQIMRQNPKVADARNEWGNMAMVIKSEYDPMKADKIGISKNSMMEATKAIEDGVAVGVYRDGEKKVPVLLKSDTKFGSDINSLKDFSIWNGNRSAPLSQISKDISTDWEWPLVKTYNRELTMAAMCDVKPENTMTEVLSEIRGEIEQIELPEGYTFFWDSQYKTQQESMAALVKYFPLAIILLVVILVALFGNFRQPIIILLILPLSLIGMIVGLLITGFEFGFFCIAGWLGLLGMIIKNVIVLIDEVNVQYRSGISLYDSVIEATVSRIRPVLMAATTTICGMIPLLFDVVFGGMAATIVFGLTFATALTLFITPALYAIFYKIKK